MAETFGIVTLLTDFGLTDHFVAAMKGVMLGLNPRLQFIDISHLVPPQDVHTGAFVLGQAWPCFPAGTIHLAVVDPGVGTARKPVVASAGGQFFVAPDNGLLTYVLRETETRVYEVTAEHYFRKPVSPTFHGRDVFAPVAAWLSRDIPVQQFGPPLAQPVRLKIPGLTWVGDSMIQCSILAVDHFGNLITNLKPEDVPAYKTPPGRCKLLAAQREITAFHRTFAEGPAGELFVVPGSTGYVEIVMREGSAASVLNLKAGAPIGLVSK